MLLGDAADPESIEVTVAVSTDGDQIGPHGSRMLAQRRTDPPGIDRTSSTSEMLTIVFARIRDGQVSGKLDPYRDPTCGCIVNTTFTGSLRGTVLEATFVTTAAGLFTPRHGEWRVQRVKP